MRWPKGTSKGTGWGWSKMMTALVGGADWRGKEIFKSERLSPGSLMIRQGWEPSLALANATRQGPWRVR